MKQYCNDIISIRSFFWCTLYFCICHCSTCRHISNLYFILFSQLMITCGMSLTYLIGAFVNWRTLALIGNVLLSGVLFTKQNQVFDVILILFVSISGIVPCLIQLLSLPFIPDSPRWLVSCPWYDCLGLYVLDMAYPSGWRFFIIIFVWVKTCHQVVLVIFCRQRSAAWRRVILHYSALEEKILMFTKRPMKSEYVFRMHSCVAKGRSQMD